MGTTPFTMTSYAAKLVAKRFFKENTSNQNGYEDPYFETVPATRLGGLYKTTKKRKRALPPGLTPEEEKILTKAKRRAYRVDLSLGNFCGTRFGWGAVIGLIPAIGDVADLLLAFMVYRTCCSVELPSSIKSRMVLNMAIDFGIGLVPFIRDIAGESAARTWRKENQGYAACKYSRSQSARRIRYTSRRENGRSHRDRRDVERGETGAPSLPARTR